MADRPRRRDTLSQAFPAPARAKPGQAPRQLLPKPHSHTLRQAPFLAGLLALGTSWPGRLEALVARGLRSHAGQDPAKCPQRPASGMMGTYACAAGCPV